MQRVILKELHKIVAQGDWIDEDSIINNIYASSGVTTEEAANKVRSCRHRNNAGVGTFSVNAMSLY